MKKGQWSKVLFAALSLSEAILVFNSCVAAKRPLIYESDLSDVKAEMSIVDMGSEAVMKHYSPKEVEDWNVLIIDTSNTNKFKESIDVYKDLGYEVPSWDVMEKYQDMRMNSIFKSVSHTNNGGDYDIIMIRDFYERTASNESPSEVSSWHLTLKYYIVSPGTYGYLYRGEYSSNDYERLAWKWEERNERNVENLILEWKGGLDLYTKE